MAPDAGQAVAEVAAIGVRHPKWDERPLPVAALKPGQNVTKKLYWTICPGRSPIGVAGALRTSA
jgi:acyl-CoA synthetase (AMP-forming)/AMP-acid ligase II